MTTVLIICLMIIFIVIILSVITITKAYQFKHTIDSLPPEEETDRKEQ
ncbi:YtzI protein [Bacillus massiliigorillae]|nr:YtzI protein [Bacillus massiliigorillae]